MGECLENSVSKWPALEGRYLQLGGVTFKYDPKKEGGQRVIDGSVVIAGAELELHRKYNICTTGYMALGKDGYDTIKEFDRETSLEILEDCYNRKAQKKNMYIASIQEAVNQSFVVGLLGRSKTIKSDKNITAALDLAEGKEDDDNLLANKRTIKDMYEIKKNTDSPLSVIELLAQNGDVNTIRRYMKYFLANSYTNNADGEAFWSVEGIKQGSCVGVE